LVAAFAISAVSKAFTGLAAGYAASAEGGALPASTGRLNFQPTPTTMLRCIIIARGSHSEGTEESIDSWLTKLQTDYLISNEYKYRYEGLGAPAKTIKFAQLDHLIEVQVLMSQNGKYISMAPVYSWFRKSIDDDTSGTRSVAVSIAFQKAGEEASGENFVFPNVKLGMANIYPPYYQQRFLIETPWFTGYVTGDPQLKPVKLGADGKPDSGIGGARPVAAQATSATKEFVIGYDTLQSDRSDALAVSIKASIVETRQNKAGRAFIAGLVTENIEKLKESVTSNIKTNEQREATNVAAVTENLNDKIAVSKAKVEADSAILAYCDSLDKGNLRLMKTLGAAAYQAQLELQKAQIKDDNGFRYSALIVPEDSAKNRTVCKEVSL
jgi:hypothetical protein